jgi:hypothetical protein
MVENLAFILRHRKVLNKRMHLRGGTWLGLGDRLQGDKGGRQETSCQMKENDGPETFSKSDLPKVKQLEAAELNLRPDLTDSCCSP